MEKNEQQKKTGNNFEKKIDDDRVGSIKSSTDRTTGINPVAKMLICRSIITDNTVDAKNTGGAQDLDDVLIFLRSVQNIDYSLE